jgi:SAM-dependent methyltransferase
MREQTPAPDPSMASRYGDAFYQTHMSASLASARKYADILGEHHRPRTVADVGCGRGTWLQAFAERGATRVVGFDGPWNSQDVMIDDAIEFRPLDLNRPGDAAAGERFDLAMSLEVGEHLEPESSEAFVRFLASLSDVVLYSAAFSGQGGVNHINERPHSSWAQIYARFGYSPYDLFRQRTWGDDDISFWYRQNAFLYVRDDTPLARRLADAGLQPVANLAFMDCIHPELYALRLSEIGFKALLREAATRTLPKSLQPLAVKLKKRVLG